MKLKSLVSIVVLFAIGCSSMNVKTEAKSYKDLEDNQSQIKKVIVYATTKNLQYGDYIESNIVKYIQKNYECNAVKSLDIINPARTYSDDELKSILIKHSIDALLIFDVKDVGYNNTQFTMNQPYQTYGDIYNRGGGMYSYNMQTYGGPQTYNFIKPYLYAVAELYDIVNKRKLWIVQLNSYGNAFADIDDTLNDAIKTTVKKLEEDGIIKRKQKKQ